MKIIEPNNEKNELQEFQFLHPGDVFYLPEKEGVYFKMPNYSGTGKIPAINLSENKTAQIMPSQKVIELDAELKIYGIKQ